MKEEEIKYPVYKGLQKPLVYKGFKGRYIFWGIGSLISGFVIAGVMGTLVNVWLGFLGCVVVIVGGLYYTSQKQKAGLYSKNKNRKIQIVPPSMKRRKFKNRENEKRGV